MNIEFIFQFFWSFKEKEIFIFNYHKKFSKKEHFQYHFSFNLESFSTFSKFQYNIHTFFNFLPPVLSSFFWMINVLLRAKCFKWFALPTHQFSSRNLKNPPSAKENHCNALWQDWSRCQKIFRKIILQWLSVTASCLNLGLSIWCGISV